MTKRKRKRNPFPLFSAGGLWNVQQERKGGRGKEEGRGKEFEVKREEGFSPPDADGAVERSRPQEAKDKHHGEDGIGVFCQFNGRRFDAGLSIHTPNCAFVSVKAKEEKKKKEEKGRKRRKKRPRCRR